MLAARALPHRRGREEAEKPFWISYADLMTALMVLFLVVMGVALLAITNHATQQEQREAQHRRDIDEVFERLSAAAERVQGVKIDRARHVIDFGDRARFGFGKWTLAPEQEDLLRRFAPELITLAESSLGRRTLKRVVVEGYADRTGSYLGNLNLSLQRSQRVLCAMFATSGASLLSEPQKRSVRDLFLVGGYSFNAAKDSDEASRRVEMRLEFLGLDETRPETMTTEARPASMPVAAETTPESFGVCALH